MEEAGRDEALPERPAPSEGPVPLAHPALRWPRLATAFLLRHPWLPVVGVCAMAKAAMVLTVWWALDRPEGFLEQMATAWDGGHFLRLAQEGHTADEGGRDFAFGPLYSWLVRLLGADWKAMLLIANAASLGAVALVTRLMGLRAGLFLGLFPLWLVYGTVGYSEALFVLLGAAALLLVRGRSVLAGAAGGVAASLAVLTRYSGAVGFAVLGLFLLWRRRTAGLAFTGVGLAALAFIALWHHQAGGSALVYFQAQRHWGASLAWPWQHVDWLLHGYFTNSPAVLGSGPPALSLFRNAVVWFLAVGGVWRLWEAGHRALVAYSAPVVLLLVCTEGLPAYSLPRLALAAFPALAVHGLVLRRPSEMLSYVLVGWAAGAWILTQHVTGRFFA